MQKPKVFTIAPGASFLRTFAKALMDGQILDGFSGTTPPLEMANTKIYVPTKRAAQELAHTLADILNGRAALLPVILPLGQLEEAEATTNIVLEQSDFLFDLQQAASEIKRRVQLSELILTWTEAMTHAIVSVDTNGIPVYDQQQAFAVAYSNADIWHLAGELTKLIDELIIEGIEWKELNALVLPEFDPYWRITLQFLNIAISQWPEILAKQGLIDNARRQILLVEHQIALLEKPGYSAPVIAIGSTGSTPATAKLLRAISRNNHGAVVLPGLDQDLDDKTWEALSKDSATHPQAVLARLLQILEIDRNSIISLGEPASPLILRRCFLSEALRPADTTEQWTVYRDLLKPEELEHALEKVSLIEASDEREEALCIAIAMRETLEMPGQTAALLTPSRDLAQRVQVELHRWGIQVDDTAGEKLRHSSYGILAELIINAAVSELEASTCASVLQHPLVRLGLPRDELVRLAQLVEIGILRTPIFRNWLEDPESLVKAAKDDARNVFAHPARNRIHDEDWIKIEDLMKSFANAFSSFRFLQKKHSLAQWIAAHREALHKLTGDTEVEPNSFQAMNDLFDQLVAESSNKIMFTKESYAFFMSEVADEIVIRNNSPSHPRLKILGLLEGRLMEADVMILAGLDETIWPPAVRSDAFLNRPMRTALGLSPPERRLGQTAHDFAQAFGNRQVILTRSAKRNGAPTVASRLVQRMAAVAGDTWQQCRTRGQTYIDLSHAIERMESLSVRSQKPTPRPPVGLRPKKLSVSKIEILRRDPYAIFAEFILNIKPFDPFTNIHLIKEIGIAVHATLETFVLNYPTRNLPEMAYEKLLSILQATLANRFREPEFAAFGLPLLERGLKFYLDFEKSRRDKIEKIYVELDGSMTIPLADGSSFVLTARADRIEVNFDGSISIIDYKTGTPPGNNEIIVGFSPQLTLEAAIALKGGFGFKSMTTVVEAIYLKIGGKSGGRERKIDPSKNDGMTIAQLAETHLRDLTSLLNHFRNPNTGYPSQPFPKFLSRSHTYDHLARVKEWSLGGSNESDA